MLLVGVVILVVDDCPKTLEPPPEACPKENFGGSLGGSAMMTVCVSTQHSHLLIGEHPFGAPHTHVHIPLALLATKVQCNIHTRI